LRSRPECSVLFAAAALWTCGGTGSGAGSDAETASEDPWQASEEAGPVGGDAESAPSVPGVEVAGLFVEVIESPPRVVFREPSGRTIAETVPGAFSLASVQTTWQWLQGFAGASQVENARVEFPDGRLVPAGGTLEYAVQTAEGSEVARIRFAAAPDDQGVVWTVSTSEGSNQVRFRFACAPDQRFYGLGGQSHASEFRAQTIPIRVAEQGLGKDPGLPEGTASLVGHVYDAYFPLPYLVSVRPGASALAHGLVLDSRQRSRFLICSEEPDVLEIQAACEPDAGGGCSARLSILPGPTPKDVIRRFTGLYGRPNPVPPWAFGPWVAFVGEPKAVAQAAESLRKEDIAATAVWDQDFRDYAHPDLTAMAEQLHALGLRVLTYFNTFLVQGTPEADEAIDSGLVPTREDGTPYWFDFITDRATLVDLTNPKAWKFMADRLRAAWDRGVDGWMADYGEWIAPDMHLHDGRTGVEYANLYPLDWARLNDEVLREKRPDPDSALFFSRSGSLGSNRWLRVVWAGDQLTSFDALDGLPSVIPYGTSLGFAGVSAFGHDIAGYTGYVSPPSTKELYFRWTELGAWTPVMRTHRGLAYDLNWNWDTDAETVAQFRRYALLHLRLWPYLDALHRDAVSTGIPAMRHVVVEFPDWEGAAQAHHDFLLGPSVFVAPVIEDGARTRTVSFPPALWYDLEDATAFGGPKTVTVEAPLDRIPVFLRAGGILPLLPEPVRSWDPAPGRPGALDVGEEELELRVGSGESGRLTLWDRTEVSLAPSPGAPVLNVRMEPEGLDLSACADGEDPATSPCFATLADSRIGVAARRGPGSLLFGPVVTGSGVSEVRISDGPVDRLYRVFLYGTGPCVNSR